jgi:RHS repeat-associated protein
MKLSSRYLSLLLILVTGMAAAQVATGMPPFGSFGGGPFDVVNLGDLNVHFAIPVLHKAGRGMPFIYDLSYDSSFWTPTLNPSTGVDQWQPAQAFGWSAQTEVATGYVSATLASPSGCSGTALTNFVYIDPSGVSHSFAGTIQECLQGGQGGVSCYGQTTLSKVLASDGSGYTLSASFGCPPTYPSDGASATVVSKGGTTYTPPINTNTGSATKTDSNGNQISVNSSGQFFDTLSSTTPVLTAAGNSTPASPTTLTYTAPTGNPAVYTVNYTQYTVATNFGLKTNDGYTIDEYPPTSNPLVSSIQLPDKTSYTFTYEKTPGSCTPLSGTYSTNCVTARIASITLPTGGSITYAYTGGTNSTGIYNDGSIGGLNRTLSPGGKWQYTRSLVTGPPGYASTWTTTVIDPNANNTVINFAETAVYLPWSFYETQRKVYQGSISSNSCSATVTNNCLLLTKVVCYNAVYTNCSTAVPNPQISQTDTYTQLPNGSTRLSEVVGPDGYGQWFTDEKEYKYGVTLGAAPSSAYLVRETSITYDTNLIGITEKPASVTVYDWSSGSQVTLASTTYGYDQSAVTSTNGTPQHVGICSRCSRGNVTTLTRSTSSSGSVTKTFTYYDTGNLNVATDVNGATATYTYSSAANPYNSSLTASCGNSFPTTITQEPTGLSASSSWNCIGGVMASSTDANGNVTTTDYTTNPNFWLPDYTLDPLQNKTTFTYTGQTAVESTLTFNGGNSVSDSRTTVDGFARPMLSQRAQKPSLAEYDSLATCYNVMGQVSFTSMPYTAVAGSTSCAAPGTTTTYDALGRPLTVTDGGGGTTIYQYINNDVLQTAGPTQTFQKQFEYDGLGRLASVCEITSASGSGSCGQSNSATGFLTKYTYDALGNLLTVAQNAQPGAVGGQQGRTYTYDYLSRLTSESNPETGTITYTYDTNTTCGTSDGDLVKKLDAVGNTICYAYDSLHRPTSMTHPTGTYASVTPDSYLVYDGATVDGAAMQNAKARNAEAYTVAHAAGSSGTKLTDEGFSYDADGRQTDLYQSTPNSGGYYHTTAGYWANGVLNTLGGVPNLSAWTFTPDGEGRPYSATYGTSTDWVTSTTYYPSNATNPPQNVVTFGNGSPGDTDTYTYDANTGRMNQFQFNTSSTPITTTGALGWNANWTLGTLGMTVSNNSAKKQNCTYVYDALARINSVDCVNGSTTEWTQSFTLDPFGNLSKSGTSSFDASYLLTNGTTNNQEQTVGSCTPTYDANGNLTKDCSFTTPYTYTWNADSNPLNLDGVGITFDALGRQVEIASGSTHAQILYSPLGKMGVMNGQTPSTIRIPLPGGSTMQMAGSTGGTVHILHSDWLGSARISSTYSGRAIANDTAYAPYGESYDGTSSDLNFTGQSQDTLAGLYDFLYRKYNPVQGRWISPDPSGMAAVNPANPQTWNRYAYVANKPLSNTDPLGLDCAYADTCDIQVYGNLGFETPDWEFSDGYWGPGAIFPLPCLTGCPTLSPPPVAQSIFSGEDCLYCYPLGANVMQILQNILSGNYWGALQQTGAIPQDPNCEFGACGDSFPGAMNAQSAQGTPCTAADYEQDADAMENAIEHAQATFINTVFTKWWQGSSTPVIWGCLKGGYAGCIAGLQIAVAAQPVIIPGALIWGSYAAYKEAFTNPTNYRPLNCNAQ